MQIYLLRHGIAEDAAPGRPDSERPLTSEGRERLRRVLKRARTADCAPSVILSSPYKRALETSAVAAEVLAYEHQIVKVPSLVPDGSPEEVWQEIRRRPNERSILLSSHEPLMSTMVAFLLDSPALLVDMKKATLVRIECDRLGPRPKGVLKWMLTPGVCLE
ncbi:MAG: histidine phosphatase family protein [Candidatus Solibacter sp.]